MIKLAMVAGALLVLALQGVTCESTDGKVDRANCFKDTGEVLAKHQLSEDVVKLVETLKPGQDFMILPKNGKPRRSYYRDFVETEKMFAKCDELWNLIEGPSAHVPDCFKTIGIYDRFFVDFAAANPDSRPVVEGLAACYINNYLEFSQEQEQEEMAEIGHCLAEVGKSFDSHEVPDDVVQLVNALRADTPDILSIPIAEKKKSTDFKNFNPIKPQPAGCYEVFGFFDEVMAKVSCFKDMVPHIHYLASANPELEPMVEALFACDTNHDLLGPRIKDEIRYD